MKLFTYIWRNVMRHKLRSSLTILSVSFCFALMTVLHGYLAMQAQWGKEAEKYHRLVVMNIQGFSGVLPLAYVERVANTPGVKAATQYSWYGGNYKEEQMPFAQFGVDPQSVFDVWDELTIDPEQLKAWRDTRNGCVVDRRLAARRKWKIGERIPLVSTFYPFSLDLVLCGTFDSPKNTDSLWFHWTYLDEGLKQLNAPGTGNCGTIFAKAENPQMMAQISQAIDDRFSSSDNPTRTQTETAFAQMFADMAGNIRFFILVTGIAVVFALMLVAANAMAMSMRERTTEIAVLKAIGFSRGRVLCLILGEACVITLLGGILGIALGSGFLQLVHMVSTQIMPFGVHEMLGLWMVYLLLASASVGFASGLVPAVQAARLSVIDGLRRVV